MKKLFPIILMLTVWTAALAGPPEPPIPPDVDIPQLDTIGRALRDMEITIPRNLDSSRQQLNKLLDNLDERMTVDDISIGDDSIIIRLDNDSVFIFSGINNISPPSAADSKVSVGKKIIIKANETVYGNIVNIGSDVEVRGTVNGSVWTVGANIYVAPTGYIRDGAIAVSGKVKQEPGGRIGNVNLAFKESHPGPRLVHHNTLRIMAGVFLGIYIIWILLSYTVASLFKTNLNRVIDTIRQNPWKTFFLGHLTYIIAFAAFIALLITILGIPIALIGVPIALLAGMIFAHTAVALAAGQKFLKNQDNSFRTLSYGHMVISGLAGFFFLMQFVLNSLVFMVFSWIAIGIFIFGIIPVGLGAVLLTRFGARPARRGDMAVPAAPQPLGPIPQAPTPPAAP